MKFGPTESNNSGSQLEAEGQELQKNLVIVMCYCTIKMIKLLWLYPLQ